jgi:hypothetical protein
MRRVQQLLLLLLSAGPGLAQSAADRPVLAFISDSQAPLFVESMILPGLGNQHATRLLFSDIRRQHPAHVFVLGDLVSLGFHQASWEAVDEYVGGLRADGVPVDAILGNHELMLYGKEGENNFDALFPDNVRTGYVRTVDSVAVVLLNSNFSNLTADEQEAQQRTYAVTLDSLQADTGTVAIIVCCHHSPFSNSFVVGSSREVQAAFVPLFLATPKCLLFMSGHAHLFERFVTEGKTFLVIGGGGGPRHPVRSEPEWDDRAPDVKPRFHYVTVRREGRGLTARVRGIPEDVMEIREVYEMKIVR